MEAKARARHKRLHAPGKGNMKKKDIVIIAGALLAALALYVLSQLTLGEPATTVVVTVDGREALRVPRGERYELCRSVHAEANAIISAARRDMVGGTLYLAGRDTQTGELLGDATSCAMCRRQIINAGLERVVIRRTPEEYEVVPVRDWIEADDSLPEGTV